MYISWKNKNGITKRSVEELPFKCMKIKWAMHFMEVGRSYLDCCQLQVWCKFHGNPTSSIIVIVSGYEINLLSLWEIQTQQFEKLKINSRTHIDIRLMKPWKYAMICIKWNKFWYLAIQLEESKPLTHPPHTSPPPTHLYPILIYIPASSNRRESNPNLKRPLEKHIFFSRIVPVLKMSSLNTLRNHNALLERPRPPWGAP